MCVFLVVSVVLVAFFFLSLFCLTISLIAFCCCCFLSPNRSAHHFFCVCALTKLRRDSLLWLVALQLERMFLCCSCSSCSSAAAALVSFDDWNGEGAFSPLSVCDSSCLPAWPAFVCGHCEAVRGDAVVVVSWRQLVAV